MKYTYAYKTPDGVRHEAAMEAGSREEVFERLRKDGIKAIKVVAADGSKANGETRSRGRAALVAAAVVTVLVAGIAAYMGSARLSQPELPPVAPDTASPRHQIYGDPAIMAEFERGDFSKAFSRTGDRLLAWFAQPGRLMCPNGADPRHVTESTYVLLEQFAANELSSDADVPIDQGDSRELRELKMIVNGMRQEMREYLANGNGTPRSYWRRLNERTAREMQIYERTRRELEKEASEDVREQRNDQLRRLGLRTIPSPAESAD